MFTIPELLQFFSASLDKLVKSMSEFPMMDSLGLTDELVKPKLAYPFEYFNLHNIFQPLNLCKEEYWSTLTQSFACDEGKKNVPLKKIRNKNNGYQLTMLYLEYLESRIEVN